MCTDYFLARKKPDSEELEFYEENGERKSFRGNAGDIVLLDLNQKETSFFGNNWFKETVRHAQHEDGHNALCLNGNYYRVIAQEDGKINCPTCLKLLNQENRLEAA